MKSNRAMKRLLLSGGELALSDYAATEKRIDKLFRDLVFENDCLYLKTHNGAASAGNVTDRTGFEADRNEILINSLFPKKKLMPAFAMQFFTQWNVRLAAEFKGKFCAVMSEDDGRWTYRFHIVREGEPFWISDNSEDLEKFAQPILYDIFEGENDGV